MTNSAARFGSFCKKASFRAWKSVFPMLLYWNARSVACFCFLHGQRGAWKWRITWKPRDRANNRSFTSLLIYLIFARTSALGYRWFSDEMVCVNSYVPKSVYSEGSVFIPNGVMRCDMGYDLGLSKNAVHFGLSFATYLQYCTFLFPFRETFPIFHLQEPVAEEEWGSPQNATRRHTTN